MEFPQIGDIITTKKGIELCRCFGLDYLVERLNLHPDNYKNWKFDGCSGLPYCVMEWFYVNYDCWGDIVYKCCLPHDLGYAYGKSGDTKEKKRVDMKFYKDLIEKGSMKKWEAKILLYAVELGGSEEFELSFSWAFALR